MQCSGLHADCSQAMHAAGRDVAQGRYGCCIHVGIDRRDAAGWQDAVKETEFGGAIGLQRQVIVQMIAGQVAEAGGRDGYTIQAVLIQTMGRCFQRHVVDASLGQRRQRLGQRDRIGRGQRRRWWHGAIGNEAKRAKAGGRMALGVPDLSNEIRRAAFPVCARNRCNARGLRTGKTCRNQREGLARLRRFNGDGRRCRKDLRTEHGKRPFRDGIMNIMCTVSDLSG